MADDTRRDDVHRDEAVELMRKIPRRAREALDRARELQAICDQLTEQIQEAKRLVDQVVDRTATLAQLARTSEHWATGRDAWEDDASDNDGGERE